VLSPSFFAAACHRDKSSASTRIVKLIFCTIASLPYSHYNRTVVSCQDKRLF